VSVFHRRSNLEVTASALESERAFVANAFVARDQVVAAIRVVLRGDGVVAILIQVSVYHRGVCFLLFHYLTPGLLQ